MARTPNVSWAQRPDSIFLTVELQDIEDMKVDLTATGLKFSGQSQGNAYAFEFEFFAEIIVDDSKYNAKRHLEFYLKKKEEESWAKLNKEGKLKYLKIDWNKWVDSDDEGEEFDMSGMGGMGGMPGMGGMMGGMPGMGGMGGMPGMEGMDFSKLAGMNLGEGGDSDDDLEDLEGDDNAAPKAAAAADAPVPETVTAA